MSLDKYIIDTSKKSFEWGVCDCLLFVSNWAVLSTGIDPMSKKLEDDPETIRDAYTDKLGAYKLIKKLRGDLANIMDVHFERINPAFAKKGDIVLAKIGDMQCFGLVFTKGMAAFKTEKQGIHMQSVRTCEYAWGL